MARELNEVYLVDAVRTAYGKAGPKGMFWLTRADDLLIKVINTLLERNPEMPPERIDDNVWGATTQWGDQGLTMGRTTVILSRLPYTVPGTTIDRMCAGGMTSVCLGAGEIAMGNADLIIAGGCEHMGHHPMAEGAMPNPRILAEKLVDPSALNMGTTAENLHDEFPDITKEMCDEYAVLCQQKADKAYKEGKIQKMIVPMTVWTENGWKVADMDEQPRPQTTLEGIRDLKTPFRVKGRITAGNASGLNDGACGVLLASGKACEEFGLKPKMRLVNYAFVGVKPEIMGYGPIPATHKALKNAGLKFDDLDIVESNEAFAVQVVAFMKEFGMKLYDDPRLNRYGGAIAFGHPLASSGPRLMAHLAQLFDEDKSARYGLCTMCVGLGQGGSVIWENVQG